MGLLEKLGFRITKPEFTYVVSESSKKELDKRKALYDKDAKETAQMYASWLEEGVFTKLITFHNYKNVTWGSRKFARLLNLSRNILDVEIYKETPTFTEEDRLPVLKLLMWMSILVVVPITRYHLGKNEEQNTREFFKSLLCGKISVLTESQFELVMMGVFEGILVNDSNPVLNIFHDALRFEEIQFGNSCPINWMRTELGRNEVFRVKAHKDSSSNRTPDWVIYLQEIKNTQLFVDVAASKKNTSIVNNDGISA